MSIISTASPRIRPHQLTGLSKNCIQTQENLIENTKTHISSQFNRINEKIKKHYYVKKDRIFSNEHLEWKLQYQRLKKDENRMINDLNLILLQNVSLAMSQCSLNQDEFHNELVTMMQQRSNHQCLLLESVKEKMRHIEIEILSELNEIEEDADERSSKIKRNYVVDDLDDYAKAPFMAAIHDFATEEVVDDLLHAMEAFKLSGFSSILAEDISFLSGGIALVLEKPARQLDFPCAEDTSALSIHLGSGETLIHDTLKRQCHSKGVHLLLAPTLLSEEKGGKNCGKSNDGRGKMSYKQGGCCKVILDTSSKGTNANAQDMVKIRNFIIENLMNKITECINSEISGEAYDRLEWLRKMHRISEDRHASHQRRCKLIKREEEKIGISKRTAAMKMIKKKLELYFTKKLESMIQLQQNDLINRCLDASARTAQMAINAERVKFRQEKLTKKCEIIEENRKKSMEEMIAKQKRLHTLAMTVPYYSNLKEITSNIEKPTASCLNAIFEPSDGHFRSNFQRGVMTGFTDEKLFSDPKFRLAYALHESGVASSAYSCAVVKRLIPREPERTTGIQPY